MNQPRARDRRSSGRGSRHCYSVSSHSIVNSSLSLSLPISEMHTQLIPLSVKSREVRNGKHVEKIDIWGALNDGVGCRLVLAACPLPRASFIGVGLPLLSEHPNLIDNHPTHASTC